MLWLFVDPTGEPFITRARHWDIDGIPVGVDILIYTEAEVARMQQDNPFARTVAREAVWIYERP